MNNDDLMSQITKDFADGQTAWADIHELYRQDVKFGIGDQWTSEDKVLRANRPMITINKVGGSIKQMIGKARRNRPRIKVTPVDSRSDPNIASIINGLIRMIVGLIAPPGVGSAIGGFTRSLQRILLIRK